MSVLFADLVGFTSLSEERDAEEVRELLTRYFETTRRMIERYGGAVEKFIGDAVMAVWGTPVAQEDDAERAVRAALDLVEAVRALGAEVAVPELRARVGVLTGEAAVAVGASGQGMVAGDLVNTASRIQSTADPGNVLVGESTRRSTDAAIAYEDAGVHELKGKSEPLQLWRAVRVMGGVRGALKSQGLEAPFVGRDRELRLAKELFHASAEERKAHLVSVIGIAGIGKSRLAWEFYKYIDGVAETVRWHRGRCLAYGDGVTYWALAEMVRMRAGIVEGEDPESARQKLRAAVDEYFPEREEAQWTEPRLAHLLGLEDRPGAERQELFSAWRLLFERISEKNPVVMVFEDLQWADRALLDFIEYVLDWSRNHPVFVMTLARPELQDRHGQWATGKRNFTSLFLEPLQEGAMEELLTGLVPGLPSQLQTEILERAEGVPLYAVETLRMLIDRGLLVREGAQYRLTGDVPTLEVPETLHALIAARLDGLDAEERKLIQHAAVVGKTFTTLTVASILGTTESAVGLTLTSLVRKEVLGVQADPRSPERGQYGFLQDLVRRVAYQTLSKRERKALHLAAADYLETHWRGDEQDVVEIVASHYVNAFEAAPDAPDAGEIKDKARGALTRAGRRAAALGANEDAQRYFEQALGLAEDAVQQAELHEEAGRMALAVARMDLAIRHFDDASQLFTGVGRTHDSARASARLAQPMWRRGDLGQAIERMEAALEILGNDEPDHDLATLAAQLARLHYFAGHVDQAAERVDSALQIAESLALPDVVSEGLNTKWLILAARGRIEEGFALVLHALRIALENDEPASALRAYNNVVVAISDRDQYEEGLEYADQGLALSRKLGDRFWEGQFLSLEAFMLFALGRWDDALATLEGVPTPEEAEPGMEPSLSGNYTLAVYIESLRGRKAEAARYLKYLEPLRTTQDVQDRSVFIVMEAFAALHQGRYREAREGAELAIDARAVLGLRHDVVTDGYLTAIEASLGLSDQAGADSFVATLEAAPPVEMKPRLRAEVLRFRARLAAARGEHGQVESRFKGAAGMFRELGMPFYLAVTLLEHGEWLVAQHRLPDADPLLTEARVIFERLDARPWLERLEKTEAPRSQVAV